MSNKRKFWLTLSGLLLWSATWFMLGDLLDLNIMIGNINGINFIAITPLFCVFIGEMFTGRPRFIKEYLEEVVERDSQRGVFSIHNLGLIVFLLAPVIIYLLFS